VEDATLGGESAQRPSAESVARGTRPRWCPWLDATVTEDEPAQAASIPFVMLELPSHTLASDSFPAENWASEPKTIRSKAPWADHLGSRQDA
jgi:hypothetical protein